MRTPEAKAQRRQAILAAARDIFTQMPYSDIKVLDIVSATGLAKGTFYLYFQSKESLFLALLLEELQGWFTQLQSELSGRRICSSWTMAHLLATTLGEQPLLRKLLSLLHNVLEASLDAECALAFKRNLAELMAPMAQTLEKSLKTLAPGDGARLLLNLHAIVIGLEQMSQPGPIIAAVLTRPELRFLQSDFESELEQMLIRLLSGWDQLKNTEK